MKTWWEEGDRPPRYAPLAGDRTADVVVVGAGITGLTAAVRLARAGKQVVVLEADRVASGTSGHTSAHLTVETDTDLDQLKTRVGEDGARAGVAANRRGLEIVAGLDRELGGRGGFRRVPGYLWAARPQDLSKIERMAELYARYGEPADAPVDVPLPIPAKGMRLRDQALFHPVRYLTALAELAVREGVVIHEQSRVVDWQDGAPVRAATPSGTVTAQDLILATHTPPSMVPSVQARMSPMLSFLLVARPRQPIEDALYWDTADPYHYVRPLEGGLVLVGGADVKPGKGDPLQALADLQVWAHDHGLAEEVLRRWDHMWFEPADGLPYIGRLPLRTAVWVGTGYSGTGLTWGSYAAERLSEQILGREKDEDRYFSPGRFGPGGADRVVKEQVEVTWHLVADRLKPGGDLHPADLPAGEGRLLTVDGQKVGVYRDDAGQLHAVSPVCRHMGCIVGWNALDRTWDCPCHGGRYAADGTRLWGPPMADLETKDLGEVLKKTG